MNLFLAGLYTANIHLTGSTMEKFTPIEKQHRLECKNLLESYHYVHKQTAVDKMREDGAKIFLDSGAFSAWTKGVTIDMEKYCGYIKENSDIIRVEGDMVMASVLDSIGDDLGTFQNQKRMEDLGVRPLPCFHYGEDPRYLEYYIANYSYITIGGMVAQSTKSLTIWLDDIWEKYMIDGAGHPKTKVHAFGVTTPYLMRRYPWFSVDSSTWVQWASNGTVMINEKSMPISEHSTCRKMEGQHFYTFTQPQQDAIRKIIESFGNTPERLSTEYVARWIYNIKQYNDLGISTFPEYKDSIFIPEQVGLI